MELNKIYNADCLNVMNKLPDNSIDLLLTDPPYRIHAKSGGGLHNKRDWLKNVHDDKIDEFEPLPFLELIYPKIKVFNAYIFCSKDLIKDYITFAEGNNLNWDIIIMAKNNPIPTKNNKYLSDVEYCFFMREKGAYFNNELDYKNYYKVKHINVTPNKYHSTEKPVGFIKQLIKVSSQENDIIIDPFIGSGTTAVCASMLNRNFIGYEILDKYYNTALRRLGRLDKNYYKELPEEERPKELQLF